MKHIPYDARLHAYGFNLLFIAFFPLRFFYILKIDLLYVCGARVVELPIHYLAHTMSIYALQNSGISNYYQL